MIIFIAVVVIVMVVDGDNVLQHFQCFGPQQGGGIWGMAAVPVEALVSDESDGDDDHEGTMTECVIQQPFPVLPHNYDLENEANVRVVLHGIVTIYVSHQVGHVHFMYIYTFARLTGSVG